MLATTQVVNASKNYLVPWTQTKLLTIINELGKCLLTVTFVIKGGQENF